MLVRDAREVARRWVAERAAAQPGFAGAYFAGSINTLPQDAPLPATSDVDLWLVVDGGDLPPKRGKLERDGVLLDVAAVPRARLAAPEGVLADYHVAPAFRTPNVIADPTGELAPLQAAVAAGFAERRWVTARCAHAREHALTYARAAAQADPLVDRAMAWLFANGVAAHMLLVAALRDPTVRRRYVAVREALAGLERLDVYEDLLASLGCAATDAAAAARHLAAVAEAFDDAAAVAVGSPLPYATDVSAAARPIAIDGSRALIETGLHREAMFWIAVTAARCQKLLAAAPAAVVRRHDAAFRALLADLGVASPDDLTRRAREVEALLARVAGVADEIIAARASPADRGPR